MKRLLIATDGSPASEAAVEQGLQLAHELGAAVMFVHVKPSPPTLLGKPHYRRKLQVENAEARDVLERAMSQADQRGVAADWELLEGDPGKEILRLAKARGADLIVVGSRGLGTVAGSLRGSVSRTVLHEADLPVLVARAGTIVHHPSPAIT